MGPFIAFHLNTDYLEYFSPLYCPCMFVMCVRAYVHVCFSDFYILILFYWYNFLLRTQSFLLYFRAQEQFYWSLKENFIVGLL